MKYLYFLLFTSFCFIPTHAQYWFGEDEEDHSDSEMEIGVEVGPALTTTWGHPQYPNHVEGHYFVGVYYKHQFEPWFGFQSGAYIEKVGSNLDVTFFDALGNPTGTGYHKFRFDFLTCPIMWKFSPIDEKFTLHFSVGGFFSYMFHAESILSPYPPGTPNDPNPGKESIYDEESSFNNINGGAILGAGVDYNFDFGMKAGIEIRDQLGLVHIHNNPMTSNFAFRTNSLLFLGRVAYRF